MRGKKARTSATRRKKRRPKPRRSGVRDTRAVETALAAFAHDIRTPLSGILALGELLASSDIGPRERAWAQAVKNSAEYLAQLATLAVDAAKAEATGLTLRRETFSPQRLIDMLAMSLAARAQTRGLSSAVEVKGELPNVVMGDAVRLRAALENLIDNAVKFTESGRITLEVAATRAPKKRVKLSFAVSDSGIGMTPAEIKRLFRFYAQASRDVAERFGGAGLGLALVKRVAKAMGGDLTVKSAAGRGARFVLTVVVNSIAADAAPTESSEQVRADASRTLRSLRMLCAEDNPYGRVILNTIITELGHTVDFVGSGEAAIDAVKRGGYNVVLMDITLSGIDGLEAARRIRALPPPFGQIAIVGISGRSTPAEAQAARAAGMDDYLTKPLSPSALARALAGVVKP